MILGNSLFSRLLLSGTAAVMLLTPQSVEAGPLLDWLFPRRAAARQAAALNAAHYAPGSACTTNCPTVWTQTTQRQVVLRYMPQTDYRTVWASVPVTQYRPVTSSDPVTGCTTTCMRPCTTYTWQARRVPYTTYRPVYSTHVVNSPWVYGNGGSAATGASVSYNAPLAYGNGYTPGYANGSTFSPSTVQTPSYGNAGSSCAGCGTEPSILQPGSSSTLQPSSPATLTPLSPSQTSPRTTTPADRAPTLDPRDIPGAQQGVPGNGNGTSDPNSGIGSYDSSQPLGSASPNASDKDSFSATSGERNRYIKPIPDPQRESRDSKTRSWNRGSIPRLLDPRDRTAAQRPMKRYAAVPIAWPKASGDRSDRQLNAGKTPSRESTNQTHWDDTGWHSAPR